MKCNAKHRKYLSLSSQLKRRGFLLSVAYYFEYPWWNFDCPYRPRSPVS